MSTRPRDPGPRTAPREVRRQAFLDAGWRLWIRRGYHEIAIEDLCAEAGMAKGSFYLYFHDKADLLEALMRDEFARIDAEMERISSKYPTGVSRLREFAALIDRATVDPARARVRADSQAMVARNATFETMIGEMTAQRAHRVRGWIEEAIASGEFAADLCAEDVARTFLVLCTGIAAQVRSHHGASTWRSVGPVIERLLSGLKPVARPPATS